MELLEHNDESKWWGYNISIYFVDKILVYIEFRTTLISKSKTNNSSLLQILKHCSFFWSVSIVALQPLMELYSLQNKRKLEKLKAHTSI